MTRAKWTVSIALAFLVGAGGITAWRALEPRRVPAEQPALVALDRAAFGDLRQAFNAEADKTRLLVLLSPT